MKRIIAPTLAVALAVIGFVLIGSVVASAAQDDFKVAICHATGSESNPYENGGGEIPKWQITQPNGHGTDDAVHAGDIIPPFEAGSHGGQEWGSYVGKNWDAAHIVIWENNCEVVPVDSPTDEPTEIIPTEDPTEIPADEPTVSDPPAPVDECLGEDGTDLCVHEEPEPSETPVTESPATETMTEHRYTCDSHTVITYEKQNGQWVEVSRVVDSNDGCSTGESFSETVKEEGM